MPTRETSRTLVVVVGLQLLNGCTALGLGPTDIPGATLLWRVPAEVAGPPGVDASSVYAMDLHQRLMKFSRVDGKVQFATSVPNTSNAWDVLVVQGVVVVAAGAYAGLDTATGAQRWVRSSSADQFGTLPGTAYDSLLYPSKYKSLGQFSAIDPRDGSSRWTASVLPPDSVVTSADQVRVFSPAIIGNSLAASFVVWKGTSQINRGGIALHDAKTGEQRWSHMLPVKNPNINTIPERAAIGSGAVVVASYEGYLYCYDELTGSLRWTGVSAYEANGKQTTNPDIRVVKIRGQVAVAGSGTHGFTGYDLQTGRVVWISKPKDTGGILSMLDAPKERVLAVHLGGAVSLLDAASGKALWVRTAGSEANRINGLRIAGDTVFGTSVVGGLFAWRLPP